MEISVHKWFSISECDELIQLCGYEPLYIDDLIFGKFSTESFSTSGHEGKWVGFVSALSYYTLLWIDETQLI